MVSGIQNSVNNLWSIVAMEEERRNGVKEIDAENEKAWKLLL